MKLATTLRQNGQRQLGYCYERKTLFLENPEVGMSLVSTIFGSTKRMKVHWRSNCYSGSKNTVMEDAGHVRRFEIWAMSSSERSGTSGTHVGKEKQFICRILVGKLL
jgi:hypothetical protein